MTEDYDKGEDPDLKLVAIVITLNTYRRIKRQDLLMVYVSNLSTKELHILESIVLEMTEVNQEIVIIMDGQWYVSSVGKAMSSSGVKATARREDYVTVCKYMRQEVAQQI